MFVDPRRLRASARCPSAVRDGARALRGVGARSDDPPADRRARGRRRTRRSSCSARSPSVINVVHLHGAVAQARGRRDPLRRRARGRQRDHRRPQGARHPARRLDRRRARRHADLRRGGSGREGGARACPRTPSSGRRSSSARARTPSSRSASSPSWSLAMQIAAVGILLDQPILIVGAMVVGPEFGPLAGLSVALVQRQRRPRAALAGRAGGRVSRSASLLALAHASLDLRGGRASFPRRLRPSDHPLTDFISNPDFFSLLRRLRGRDRPACSRSPAPSRARWSACSSRSPRSRPPPTSGWRPPTATGTRRAARPQQLGINLAAIVLAGVLTLFVQRRYYVARRRKHLNDPARKAAGLPVGRSARAAKRAARATTRCRSSCARARSPRR